MKKVISTLLVGILFSALVIGCSGKRDVYYPPVFKDSYQQEENINKLNFNGNGNKDNQVTEKTYLNVLPENQESVEPTKPAGKPVDVFDLGKEVKPPKGCTAGVDC